MLVAVEGIGRRDAATSRPAELHPDANCTARLPADHAVQPVAAGRAQMLMQTMDRTRTRCRTRCPMAATGKHRDHHGRKALDDERVPSACN